MGKEYCVYCHTSPTGKKYIGITSQKPINRWKKGDGYQGNREFYADIQKYGWENFEHTILQYALPHDEAENIEVKLIQELRANAPDAVYNKTKGGESNWNVLPQTGEKISNALRGRKISKESIEKRRKTMMGHFVSDETRKKIGDSHRGKTATDELREKLKKSHKEEAKPVQMLSVEGEIIKEFDSIHEAARKCGIKPLLIRRVCNGQRQTTSGYKWRFV